MGRLEEKIISGLEEKPVLYARYVDIFLLVKKESDVIALKNSFENNSVLKFTFELNDSNKQVNFLDTIITITDSGPTTSVFIKPTNNGACLNGDSECPDRYKRSVINSYLLRAYRFSETWADFHKEVVRIKRLLVNNNYSNSFVDQNDWRCETVFS